LFRNIEKSRKTFEADFEQIFARFWELFWELAPAIKSKKKMVEFNES